MSTIDVVVWSSSRFLSCSDFKAEPNPSAFEDAHSTINYRPTWMVESVQDACGTVFFLIADLCITTEFWPALSWIRQGSDDQLLLHEQGHFDMGEIVARENLDHVRNNLYRRRFPTRGKNEEQRKQFAKEDSAAIVDLEMKCVRDRLADWRVRYDSDTKYGTDSQEQSKYDALFRVLRA